MLPAVLLRQKIFGQRAHFDAVLHEPFRKALIRQFRLQVQQKMQPGIILNDPAFFFQRTVLYDLRQFFRFLLLIQPHPVDMFFKIPLG